MAEQYVGNELNPQTQQNPQQGSEQLVGQGQSQGSGDFLSKIPILGGLLQPIKDLANIKANKPPLVGPNIPGIGSNLGIENPIPAKGQLGAELGTTGSIFSLMGIPSLLKGLVGLIKNPGAILNPVKALGQHEQNVLTSAGERPANLPSPLGTPLNPAESLVKPFTAGMGGPEDALLNAQKYVAGQQGIPNQAFDDIARQSTNPQMFNKLLGTLTEQNPASPQSYLDLLTKRTNAYQLGQENPFFKNVGKLYTDTIHGEVPQTQNIDRILSLAHKFSPPTVVKYGAGTAGTLWLLDKLKNSLLGSQYK